MSVRELDPRILHETGNYIVKRSHVVEALARVQRAHRDYAWARGMFDTVKVAPEFWVNQGPATDTESAKLHTTAAAFRRMLDGLLSARQGVVFTPGTLTDLKVTATGADVNITVKAGACYVRGTQATDQGMYHVYNDADFIIPLLTNNPANPTNPRIDLVVARLQDQQYSGAVDVPTIEMVTGTPAGSPLVPTAPANTLVLAQILIPAAAGAVLPANITDKRVACGISTSLVDKQDFTNVASLTIPGNPNVFPPAWRHLRVKAKLRGTVAAVNLTLDVRANNDSGANYVYQVEQASAASVTATDVNAAAATAFDGGIIAGGTAPANAWSPVIIEIVDPFSTTDQKPFLFTAYDREGTASGNDRLTTRGGLWLSLAAITFLTLFGSTGNLSGTVETYGEAGL